MSHPKLTAGTAALLGALPLWLSVARAQEASLVQTAFLPCAFAATAQVGETVGWEQTHRVFITRGTNKFVFVVPQGLRPEISPERVSLLPLDSMYFITVRLLSAADAEAALANPARGKEFLLGQFPNAKVTQELGRSAAGRTGPALELRHHGANGMERAVCAALIPSAAGILEFCLNAVPGKFAEGQQAFNALLRTFRSNESGKLEVAARVLDQS